MGGVELQAIDWLDEGGVELRVRGEAWWESQCGEVQEERPEPEGIGRYGRGGKGGEEGGEGWREYRGMNSRPRPNMEEVPILKRKG